MSAGVPSGFYWPSAPNIWPVAPVSVPLRVVTVDVTAFAAVVTIVVGSSIKAAQPDPSTTRHKMGNARKTGRRPPCPVLASRTAQGQATENALDQFHDHVDELHRQLENAGEHVPAFGTVTATQAQTAKDAIQ